MIIIEYAKSIWVKVLNFDTNIFNVLLSKGDYYVEITEYFFKHFGIAIRDAEVVNGKLKVILVEQTICTNITSCLGDNITFGSNLDYDEDGYPTSSYLYILLDIKQ